LRRQARFERTLRFHKKQLFAAVSRLRKILVIGAARTVGAHVVEPLGEGGIRASRNSGERVEISDPKSLATHRSDREEGGRDRLHRWRALQAPCERGAMT
jgi:nucleoside-diphosphate-sugar epimerase